MFASIQFTNPALTRALVPPAAHKEQTMPNDNAAAGMKFDDGKPDYTLVPWDCFGGATQRLIVPLYQWYRHGEPVASVVAEMRDAYNDRGLDYIALLADVLNYGAKKYAPWNWEKGISRRRLYAAACRHYKAILDGEEIDRESGLPHTAHLAFYGVAISKATD